MAINRNHILDPFPQILAASFGVFGVLLAFIVKFLGSNVIQATFSVIGITTGPSLGIFLLGLLTTKANWVGASTGNANTGNARGRI